MGRPITTLIHLSGGQDSTYCLLNWLREHRDETILVHHVELRHQAENRLEHERRAVKQIINYLHIKGYSNLKYYDSVFSYGNLPRISIKDIQIVSLFTGIILRTPGFEDIRTIILPWHQGEVNADEINRGFRVKAMLRALELDPDKYEFVFPVEHKTRAEMAADMPQELLRLCHCCRTPSNGYHCGKCKTCMELKEAGIWKHFNYR